VTDHAANGAPRPEAVAWVLGGAKPAWVVDVTAWESDFDPWEDHTLVDSQGFVVHTIELVEAPGYVVPITFSACRDDLSKPYEVTLDIEVRITAGANIRRVTCEPRRTRVLKGSRWPLQGMSEFEHLGEIQERAPTLKREALAHAAMPSARPHIDEMGYHVDVVLPQLERRKQRRKRTSTYERDLMRHFYAQALADSEVVTRDDQLRFVFEKLSEAAPETWFYVDDDSRSTADYKRLRDFLNEMDDELERVGARGRLPSLEPGSFVLPASWLND
jgi:hypothetical protein